MSRPLHGGLLGVGSLGVMSLGVASLALGCAFGPGEPMGQLEPELTARYVTDAPGRQAPDGFQRLASDFQVRLTRAELETGPVALVEEGAAGAAFDPANPPPGYSLCHNGHCHAADGRLVSYEDIAAELGGGAKPRTVVTLPSPGTLDLLADTGPRPLACEPDCTLSATTLGRLSVPVRRLHLEGEVRDSRSLSRLPVGLPFVFELVLPAGSGPPVLAAPLALQVSRELPPRIHLDVALTPGPWLFDGVQWASLAGGGGPVTLSPTGNEAERAAYEQVLASLGEGTLAGSYERSSL